MNKILIIFGFLFLVITTSKAQDDLSARDKFEFSRSGQESICDCAVILSSPSRGQTGNLDLFRKENCDQTVMVTLRGNINNLTNNINDVMVIYGKSRHPICLDGRFSFEETILIPSGTNLHLLPGTTIHYTGDGMTPGIDFEGGLSTLRGTSSIHPSVISTSVPMTEGLIRIKSEDLVHSLLDNATYNQIQNLVLINTNTDRLTDFQEARNNMAIFLENSPESITTTQGSGDQGTNYYTNISNIEIDGFSLGVRLRGECSSNKINNISISNIPGVGYGFWISGSVDNAISDIKFANSNEAIAVRFDNHLQDKWNTGDEVVDGQFIGATIDPSIRVPISTSDILDIIINNARANIDQNNGQELFNATLSDIPFSTYRLINESCYIGASNLFVTGTNNISRFSLTRFNGDDVLANGYGNFPKDGLDITGIDSDPNCPQGGNPICLYSDLPTMSTTILATCSNETFLTSYFLRPRYNSISTMNIFDAEGELQVFQALEIADSETNVPVCERTLNSINCEINCDIGRRNEVFLCPQSENNPTTIPINDLVTFNTSNNSCQGNAFNDGILMNGSNRVAYSISFQ